MKCCSLKSKRPWSILFFLEWSILLLLAKFK